MISFFTHTLLTLYIYNNIHFLFAGASETNGANNAKSSGGVEKRDTSNRSRGRSSSGRGGTGSLDVFIDRGVVNKVVGKLVSGILNSNNLNMPMLMMVSVICNLTTFPKNVDL